MQKLMRAIHKEEKGFTLVELMVVVVIIGILVAIAIPIYQNVTANANRNTVESNLRIIDGAIEMYRADNGSAPADATPATGVNVLDGYLQSWPSGPDGALYGISGERAIVTVAEDWGTATTSTLQDLPWWGS